MGVPVDPAAADELAAVLAEMLEEPQNLSSVRDIDTAISVHVVDSLSGMRRASPTWAAAEAFRVWRWPP